MNLVNLTPHEINYTNNGKGFVLPPTGVVARVNSTEIFMRNITTMGMHIPIYNQIFFEVENLPNPKADTLYIVSSLVRENANRKDLISPCDYIRDDEGRIIGCRGFISA